MGSDLTLNILLTANSSRARSEFQSFVRSATGSSSGLGVVTGAAIGVTAAVAGIAVAATKMAGDYQQSMNRVQALTGASNAQMAQYNAALLKLAQNAGVAPKQLADGLYQAISAGYSGAKAIQILTLATQDAKIGMTDAATTANALTNVLANFSKQTKDANLVNGIMLETVTLGKSTFQQYASTITKAATTAAQFHISLQTMSAAWATMTANGITAGKASTDFVQLVQSMDGKISTVTKSLQKNGIAFNEAKFNTLDFAGKVQMLNAAMQEAAQKHVTVTGVTLQAAQALQVLSGHMDVYNSDLKTLSNNQAMAQKTQQAWAITQSGFNQSMDRLGATVQVLLIQLGQKLLPVLTPIINQFANWLSHSNLLQSGIGLLTKFITDVLMPAGQKVFSTIGTLITQFIQWNDKTHFVQDALAQLGTAINDVVGVLSTLVSWVSAFFGWLTNGGPQLQIFIGSLEGLALAFAGLKLADVTAKFANMFTTINQGQGYISGLADIITGKLAPNLKTAMGSIKVSADEATAAEEAAGTAAETKMASGIAAGSAESGTSLAGVAAAASGIGVAMLAVLPIASAVQSALNNLHVPGGGPATGDTVNLGFSLVGKPVDLSQYTDSAMAAKAAKDAAEAADKAFQGMSYQAQLSAVQQAQAQANSWEKIKQAATDGGRCLSTQADQAATNAIQSFNHMQQMAYQDTQGYTQQATALLQSMGDSGNQLLASADKSTQFYWNQLANYLSNAQSQLDSFNASVARDQYNSQHSTSATLIHAHAAGATNLAPNEPYIAGEDGAELIVPSGRTDVLNSAKTQELIKRYVKSHGTHKGHHTGTHHKKTPTPTEPGQQALWGTGPLATFKHDLSQNKLHGAAEKMMATLEATIKSDKYQEYLAKMSGNTTQQKSLAKTLSFLNAQLGQYKEAIKAAGYAFTTDPHNPINFNPKHKKSKSTNGLGPVFAPGSGLTGSGGYTSLGSGYTVINYNYKFDFGPVTISVPKGTTKEQAKELLDEFDKQFAKKYRRLGLDTPTSSGSAA